MVVIDDGEHLIHGLSLSKSKAAGIGITAHSRTPLSKLKAAGKGGQELNPLTANFQCIYL